MKKSASHIVTLKLLKNIFKASFAGILKNKLRSLLTSLGIIIGVCSVIVMSAIGQGTRSMIESEINSLGTDVIIVLPGASRTGGVHRGIGSYNIFTLDDVEAIGKQASALRCISPVVRSGGQVIAGDKNWATEIIGVTNDYFSIKNWSLEYGDFFTEQDLFTKRKVALIGRTIARELFGDTDPTGRKIRLRTIPFTVIGVLKEKGQSGMGQDQDDIILAPATTVLYHMKGGRYIDMIHCSALSGEHIGQAQEELKTILREAHRLSGKDADDFIIQSQTEIAEAVTKTTGLMTMFLGAIASISLIVGGIGIMNIMLVSVTERTREIGIRLSVGGRCSDIMLQFLAEATTLSVFGGIAGMLIAFAIAFGINRFTSYLAVITADTIGTAVFFSACTGICFGFFPARKAALLNPIEALRSE